MSICRYVYLSVCSSVSLSVYPSARLSIRPSVSVHLSVCPSVRLSVSPSVRLYLSFCPSVRLSFCPSVHLSFCPSVRLSICSSVHLVDMDADVTGVLCKEILTNAQERISLHKSLHCKDIYLISRREFNSELFWELFFDKLYTMSDKPFVKRINKPLKNGLQSIHFLRIRSLILENSRIQFFFSKLKIVSSFFLNIYSVPSKCEFFGEKKKSGFRSFWNTDPIPLGRKKASEQTSLLFLRYWL